jgi:hypothetical protein
MILLVIGIALLVIAWKHGGYTPSGTATALTADDGVTAWTADDGTTAWTN